jgi:hypothetical protein
MRQRRPALCRLSADSRAKKLAVLPSGAISKLLKSVTDAASRVGSWWAAPRIYRCEGLEIVELTAAEQHQPDRQRK